MKKVILTILCIAMLLLLFGFIYLPFLFNSKYKGQIIKTSDGKGLVTIIHLPEGKGPFPTLITRSPYKLPHTALSGMDSIDLKDVQDNELSKIGWPEVTDAGYAFVIQHTRGRVGSEGEVLSLKDKEDSLELIQWIKQQSWSNGKVGSCGDSIEAILAMITNAENPSGLDASFVQLGTPNLINDVLLGPGGALKFETFFPWIAEQVFTADNNHFEEIEYGPIQSRIERIKMGLMVKDILSNLDSSHQEEVWNHLPIKNYPSFSSALPSWNKILEATPNSEIAEYFDASNSKVPTYFVAAWHDVFASSQIESFANRESDSLSQRLLILNGTHFTPENPRAWPIKPMLPWFDYHLKGKKSKLLDLPKVIFQLANEVDKWYGTETWPPIISSNNKWFLSETGKISKDSSSHNEGRRTFLYNPKFPVPTIGGKNLLITHGTLDQVKLRQNYRKDVLSYNSRKLVDDLLIAGRVKGTISISSDCRDTDFTIKLLDVSPDGSAKLVTDGVIRARYRKGRDQELFMQPDSIYALNIDLGHMAWRFKSGHKIGIDISSSNFPQWDRNLNTEHTLYSSTEIKIAKNTVYHNQLNSSFIELPVVINHDSLNRLDQLKTGTISL